MRTSDGTKRALITGITGQDGRLLSGFLLQKGYEVVGLIRRVTNRDLSTMPEGVHYIHGNITNYADVVSTIANYRSDEVYHLAAISDVSYSFMHPHETYDVNINGTLNILHAVREQNPAAHVYFAGSSEMFGRPTSRPQNEDYPMMPRSPYAISKLAGYWTCRNYRQAYGMNVSCGILYNHESELRGPQFVTRKITLGIANYLKTGQPFKLGNMQARKDWGYAPDYVRGMWMMLQRGIPDNYVLATGEYHTVRQFLERALDVAGINCSVDTETLTYYDTSKAVLTPVVSSDPQLYRPVEADNYQGDYSLARRQLGWEPTVKFDKLVEIMMKHDMKEAGV